MARKDDTDLRTKATTLLARLDDKAAPKLPAALGVETKAFRAVAVAFDAAAQQADDALVARDGKLTQVGDADAALDASVDDLAAAIVGAKLGSRTQPFKGLSPHTPSALRQLAYKREVDAVGNLLDALARKAPPAAVKAAIQKTAKLAAIVQVRLDALTGPEAAYVKARAGRDNLLPGLAKALSRFRLKAKAALADEPETYAGLFAPRSAVQAPAKKRPKKAAPGADLTKTKR